MVTDGSLSILFSKILIKQHNFLLRLNVIGI